MSTRHKKIIIGIMLLVNLISIAVDDINENDLYLNLNLFSMNYQSLSGENTYKYSQMFGLSDNMKEHINLNDKINFELESGKSDLTKGNILYWRANFTTIK